MGAHAIHGLRRTGASVRAVGSACLIAALLSACAASPTSSGEPPTELPTPVGTLRSTAALQPSPTPELSPAAAWTSIDWIASDPAPFSGQGNQYVFGGVPWAGGAVLVGEEAPLPTGNVEGVVWASSDNTHWQRVPNTSGTFSGSEIEGVAATGSTLVAVGYSRLEDNASTLTPPVGIAWISSDGTHWRRVPDEGEILGKIVLHGVVAGSSGFVAYGNGLGGGAALAFSSDGLHWQREGDNALLANSGVAAITWTGQGYAAVGSHDVAQASGVVSQPPGQAAAWWSSDGRDWHQSDVGSTGYQIESVQPWVDSLRAVGAPPCPGCISAPTEWRSSDGGRAWHQLPLASSPDYPGLEGLLVGQRAVSLQEQPERVTWSVDGQTWSDLAVSGSPIPDTAQLVMAVGQTVIAITSVTGASANDQEDMGVFAGDLH